MKEIVSYILIGFALFAYASCSSVSKSDEKNKLSSKALLDEVQEKTFNYFWNGAEQTSGMARERFHVDNIYPDQDKNVVTSGGSGFGLMALIVGIERGFITREEGIERFQKIVSFLENADSFHGAFPHWWYGETGKVRGFSDKDNGGDIVETAFLVQGLLTVHQYLKADNELENVLRKRINTLWRNVDWNWYRNGQDVLFWHWSPKYEFGMNHMIKGFDECLITYILGAASPTHSIPASAYHKGWARDGEIVKQQNIEGQEIGLAYNNRHGIGPLFWIQYSFLGLDPRQLGDQYVNNYFNEFKNYALVNRAYCIRNPKKYKGYGEHSWGLTASYSVKGYGAHAPNEEDDKGVIAPTAAISSIVYTLEESMKVIEYLYSKGDTIMGDYGFYDAYSETEGWYPQRYLAIDQGPIVSMIENHRSQLLWNLFMSHPDVQNGLRVLGFSSPHLATKH